MDATPSHRDHRIDIGLKKRVRTRGLILDATQRIFAQPLDHRPVIQDVVRVAGISRGLFYEHFDSLEGAFVAVGQQLVDQLAHEILPVYDVLKEPWQRFSVGCRMFLAYSTRDVAWSRFVARMDAWPRESLVFSMIADDLCRGASAGQFSFDDLDATTFFFVGSNAGVMRALHGTQSDPASCIDAAIQLGLRSLGCDSALCAKAVRFSRHHLADWNPVLPRLSAESLRR